MVFPQQALCCKQSSAILSLGMLYAPQVIIPQREHRSRPSVVGRVDVYILYYANITDDRHYGIQCVPVRIQYPKTGFRFSSVNETLIIADNFKSVNEELLRAKQFFFRTNIFITLDSDRPIVLQVVTILFTVLFINIFKNRS